MSEKSPAEMVRVRLATEPDMPYIHDSWIRAYRETSFWARRMKAETYYRNHRKIIRELLHRCPTVVVYDAQNPNHLLGYACGERWPEALVMHWVMVKFPFRRWGLGKALLTAFEWKPDDPIVCTHWTNKLEDLMERFRLVYNPYLLFEQIAKERDCGGPETKNPTNGPER